MFALGAHSQASRATDSLGTERRFVQSSGTDGLSLPGLFVGFVCVGFFWLDGLCVSLFVGFCLYVFICLCVGQWNRWFVLYCFPL